MRSYTSIIMFVAILFGHTLPAQVISGKVFNKQTAKGIPFVNIGVLHKNIGTVSNADGSFTLDLGGTVATDTVKFSCIGYTEYGITQAILLKGDGTISLTPKTNQLKPVVVTPTYTKLITLGVRTVGKAVSGGFSSNDLGSELGTVFNYKKKNPGQLKSVGFSLVASGYDTLLFRLNVYKLTKGLPGENILTEPIYIQTTEKSGVLTFDLSKYNITITGPVVVSLEWIRNLYGSKLYFSFKLFKKASFVRKISQASWVKLQAGAGIWGTIETEK